MYHMTQQLYILPTHCIYMFCMIITIITHITLNINRVVFVAEECVLCEVRTEMLYVIYMKANLQWVK